MAHPKVTDFLRNNSNFTHQIYVATIDKMSIMYVCISKFVWNEFTSIFYDLYHEKLYHYFLTLLT